MKFTSLSIVTLSLLSMWHLSNAEDEKKSYIIQMKDNMSHRRMAASPSHEYKIRHVFKHARLIEMHLTKEEAKAMKKRPDVLLVERDGEVEISPVYPYEGPDLATIDPLTGQEVPYGIAMVQANDAIFNEGPTDDYVKVCVVDTGYDLGHEDLPFVNVDGMNPYPAGRWDVDGNSHGTHCAGTIAAIGNNKGVIGVISDENIPLFIGKGLTDSGSGSAANVKKAVEACKENGAKVISMSLGGGLYSDADEEFYKSLVEDDDVLVIAASGNSGNSAFSYPASYEAVLSVGAVDQEQNKASFSQYNDQVELAGPGVGVKSTVPDNKYASYSGTSMACPHVAGVAALVWSYFPNKTASEIREALTCSALDKGDAGRDIHYGWGIVQAKAAYQLLENNSTCAPTPAPTTLICGNGEAKVTVNIITDDYAEETSWTLKASNGEEVMSGYAEEYGKPNTEYSKSECLSCDGDTHTFTINDSYGDGLCCAYGSGSYEVLVNDIVEASGGEFASSETKTLSISCANPSSSPTPAPSVAPSALPTPAPTLLSTVSSTFKIKSMLDGTKCIQGNSDNSISLVDCSSSGDEQTWEYLANGYLSLEGTNKCLFTNTSKQSDVVTFFPSLKNKCGSESNFTRRKSFMINDRHNTIVTLAKPGYALTQKADGKIGFEDYLGQAFTEDEKHMWEFATA